MVFYNVTETTDFLQTQFHGKFIIRIIQLPLRIEDQRIKF